MKNYITYFLAIWCLWAPAVVWALPQRLFFRRPPTSSGGPIEYVGATVDTFSATRSPTVNYPTVLANDIIITVMATDTPATFSGTPPGSGWTEEDEADDALPDGTTVVFWKRAAGGETSEAWTNIMAANEDGVVATVVFRNCKTSGSPFNQAATPVSGGSVTNHDCPTVTTTVDGCMVVGILGIDPASSTRTYTWDAGWDERVGYATTPSGVNGLLGAIYIGSDLQTTAGASTPGGDFNSAEHAAKFTYALEPQ